MDVVPRPEEMFDRHREWSALSAFAADDTPGASLGVVSGRRRQGKTYLLRALCQAMGGFYFAAEEATNAESLRQIGAALADHIGAPAPLSFEDWNEAVDALLALGKERPIPVVIDEFPYLVQGNSRLPSIIQNALAPLRPQRDESRARLLLCGSAMSFMGRLLSGNAPLRGRAALELVVPTLNHQLAAEFWGVADPLLALKLHAIVGGTPAYRREFVRNDVPTGPGDFDSWVLRTVLSPSSPLFREGRYLLAEEPGIRDSAVYHSILAAIVSGNTSRGKIATFLGRKAGDLAHPLAILEDCGLIAREPDVFRDKRTAYRITEPLITFHHAVMRPLWSDWENSADPSRLWRRSQQRFTTQVLGPHFEQLCRVWTHHFSPEDFLADLPYRVNRGTVHDPAAQASHELDVVAFGITDSGAQPVLAIGEAKWGEVMGRNHLERLRKIRDLLARQGCQGAETARLICYSAAGFTSDLHAASEQDPVIGLVGPADLYRRAG